MLATDTDLTIGHYAPHSSLRVRSLLGVPQCHSGRLGLQLLEEEGKLTHQSLGHCLLPRRLELAEEHFEY